MNIFGVDLKIDNNNYSSFSGWFISKNTINQNQIDSLTNFLNDNNQNLNLKSFDSEGEDLECNPIVVLTNFRKIQYSYRILTNRP